MAALTDDSFALPLAKKLKRTEVDAGAREKSQTFGSRIFAPYRVCCAMYEAMSYLADFHTRHWDWYRPQIPHSPRFAWGNLHFSLQLPLGVRCRRMTYEKV